jgi:hypothetical protein
MLPSTSPLSICWTKVSIVPAAPSSDNKNGTPDAEVPLPASRPCFHYKTVAKAKIPNAAIIARFLLNSQRKILAAPDYQGRR